MNTNEERSKTVQTARERAVGYRALERRVEQDLPKHEDDEATVDSKMSAKEYWSSWQKRRVEISKVIKKKRLHIFQTHRNTSANGGNNIYLFDEGGGRKDENDSIQHRDRGKQKVMSKGNFCSFQKQKHI